MHEFWFSSVAQGLFWLGRSRLRARPPQDAHKMVQPVGILLVAVLLLLMTAGAMIGSFIWPDQEPTLSWAYLILMAMVALSLYLIADYCYARHTVSDSDMQYDASNHKLLPVRK